MNDVCKSYFLSSSRIEKFCSVGYSAEYARDLILKYICSEPEEIDMLFDFGILSEDKYGEVIKRRGQEKCISL